MKITPKIYYIFFLIMLCVSCGMKPQLNNPTPTLANQSINPTPTSENLFLIPTPISDMGVVSGSIQHSSSDPIPEVILFLSKNLTYDNPNLPSTISFSYQSDPRGVIDPQTGNFYFYNVKPAENYVITIWSPPGNTTYYKAPGEKKPLLIIVEAGKTIDIGTIQIP